MEALNLTPRRFWLGRDELPRRLKAIDVGLLSFELDGIDPRRIRFDGREVVNRIYVSVRDTDWNTLSPSVRDLVVEETALGWEARFDVRHDGAGISFSWRGAIVATPEGGLTYEMAGRAETDFRYNRIGFCVLHPASLAGRPYRATTADGPVDGTLPDLVAPQSIVDGLEVPLFPACSRLAVDVEPALRSTATFDGDLFEMEDQRNWSDGSYKTYCTPIARGYPHEAGAGQRFHQRVALTVEAPGPRGPTGLRRTRAPLSIELRSPTRTRWPELGLGVRTGPGSGTMSLVDRELIRAIRLDHLRLDLRLSDPEWSHRLAAAIADAVAVGSGLEVAVFVADATLDRLGDAAARLLDPSVRRVIALHEPTAATSTTPAEWSDLVADALASAARVTAPGRDLLVGTDGDFAELNRNRPAPGRAAGLAYAMNPQVHAFDELSLIESLPAQGDTVRTARSFADGRWIAVSPVTLRQRFNPAAEDPTATLGVEPPTDDRQPSLFAAAWLLGSIASLAGEGADSITYFETAGPRGVIGPSRAVERRADGIPAGVVYPAWFVLADLADRAALEPLTITPATGPIVTAIAARGRHGIRVLIANLGIDPADASIGPLPGETARVRMLDATTSPEALPAATAFLRSGAGAAIVGGRLSVRLAPFAYARIDVP